ncbi:MAG: hypothetical protein K2P20_02470 [Oscillospiraceae bacterium]|nr:hypothetical protein [Oscillospiraceae bacterium]
MEIKFTLPDDGTVQLRWEPMAWEKFRALCILAGIWLAGSGVLKFLEILVSVRG